MKIREVVGDVLMSCVALVRCPVDGMGSMTTRIEMRCESLIHARNLLSRVYGRSNVLSISQTVLEQSLEPVEPSKSVIRPIKPQTDVIKSIKPMNTKQAMKKAVTDNKKAIKKNERKTKAIARVRVAQSKLALINRDVYSQSR